jgi:hypothetical protein
MRSSLRLARASCSAPMSALTSPSPTLASASVVSPSATSATPIANRMLLKNVKTFARAIAQ